MAENTLSRFARLFAGVVLSQGHLGHQVLGQLLIFDATEVEVAGANLAMAATARQRGALAQVAIRTAVPALAVSALVRKREKQLEALERRLEARAQRMSEANQNIQTGRQHIGSSRSELAGQRDGVEARRARFEARYAEIEARYADLQSTHADASAKLAALDAENRKLRQDLAALQAPSTRSPESPRSPTHSTPQESPPAAVPSDEPPPAVAPSDEPPEPPLTKPTKTGRRS